MCRLIVFRRCVERMAFQTAERYRTMMRGYASARRRSGQTTGRLRTILWWPRRCRLVYSQGPCCRSTRKHFLRIAFTSVGNDTISSTHPASLPQLAVDAHSIFPQDHEYVVSIVFPYIATSATSRLKAHSQPLPTPPQPLPILDRVAQLPSRVRPSANSTARHA